MERISEDDGIKSVNVLNLISLKENNMNTENEDYKFTIDLYNVLDNYSMADVELLKKFFQLVAAIDIAIDNAPEKEKAVDALMYFWNHEGVV